ncbi:MAG TPA: ABC transporter permease, partial [Candidatus Nanopelagicales bacterium]|nr:ABC transporter permease [Candidatus Nanopelagicales bacterium]
MRAANALARRSLLARPVRTILTIIGIALGTGVLVAGLVLNAALDAAVSRSVADLLGRADVRVAAFEEQGLSPASVVAVATTPGVATVAPTLERRTYPLPSGAAATLPGPLTVVGIERAADPAVRDRLLAAGTLLGTGDDDGALVSADLARQDGLGVGATITLLGDPAAAPAAFRVVGVLASTPGDPDPGGRTVVVALEAAQRLFATDRVTAVDLLLADGADAAGVVGELERRLTVEPYTLSTPSDLAAALEAATAEVRAAIALVAAVALFGGAFLIFNTLSMTVAERVRDVGLLRAAGMTRRQVTLMVLASAAYLGVVGVALGLLVGLALTAGAVALLGGTGTALAELTLPPGALLLGAILGFIVTAAAAVEPALRAGGISPVAALRL